MVGFTLSCFHMLVCFLIVSGKNVCDFKHLRLQVRCKALDVSPEPFLPAAFLLFDKSLEQVVRCASWKLTPSLWPLSRVQRGDDGQELGVIRMLPMFTGRG